MREWERQFEQRQNELRRLSTFNGWNGTYCGFVIPEDCWRWLGVVWKAYEDDSVYMRSNFWGRGTVRDVFNRGEA